jgi:hypothetical protein
MNAIFDLATSRVIQSTNDPISVGDSITVNGRFVVPAPDGAALEISPTDTPALVAFNSAVSLLMRYPMYENAAWNFFLNSSDMAAIDVASVVPSPVASTKPRCQIGRGVGPLPVGIAPNSVAILPRNTNVAPTQPGLLVTDTIDISAIAPLGTDEVLIWWQIAQFTTTNDNVHSITQATPAIKSLTSISQEPATLDVYVSNDDGATWYQADRLLPVDLVNPGTDLRVAFVNNSSTRVNLLGFAVLYSEI